MRILVVGSTGFVGRALCRFLSNRGDEVVALARRPAADLPGTVLVVPEFDPAVLSQALAGRKVDALVNLAAAGIAPTDRDPGILAEVNSSLPCSLVAIARDLGAGAFIQAGSSAEYAPVGSGEPIGEDSPLESSKLYGATKAAGSLLALACGAHVGIPVAVLRLFNLFGPGEARHRLFPSLVASLSSGTAARLSAGTQIRDFMHVDDACGAIHATVHALADRPTLAGAYNLATGIGTTVAGFARLVAAEIDADPALLQFGALPFRPDDLPSVVGDPRKLQRSIGWSGPRPLAEAIGGAVRDEVRGAGSSTRLRQSA